MLELPRDLESDFLSFVEDDQGLPHARRDAVRQVIARDPELARLAAGMREDRAGLKLSALAKAPACVLAGLEAALEQDALASLEQRARAAGGFARSRVEVSRAGVLRTMWETGQVRRLAMAAGLALTVGVGVWGFNRVSSWQAGGGLPGLASNGAARTPVDPADPANETASELSREALAARESLNHDDAGTVPETNPDESAPAIAALTPVIDEALPDMGAAPMTADRATELAQAGRLVIRVRAADPDGAARDIHQLAQQSSKDVKWRPLEPAQVPAIFVALAGKPESRLPVPADGPDPTWWASPLRDSIPPAPPKRAPAAAEFIRRHPEMRALYTVEVPEREGELASLLSALTKGRAQVAEFVELERALPPTPSLEPGAVLWWGRSPASWVKRVSVPIVVESPAK